MQDQSLDSTFLSTVDPQPSMTAWYITLSVNGHDTLFKIDTAQEVTAVSEENVSTSIITSNFDS